MLYVSCARVKSPRENGTERYGTLAPHRPPRRPLFWRRWRNVLAADVRATFYADGDAIGRTDAAYASGGGGRLSGGSCTGPFRRRRTTDDRRDARMRVRRGLVYVQSVMVASPIAMAVRTAPSFDRPSSRVAVAGYRFAVSVALCAFFARTSVVAAAEPRSNGCAPKVNADWARGIRGNWSAE